MVVRFLSSPQPVLDAWVKDETGVRKSLKTISLDAGFRRHDSQKPFYHEMMVKKDLPKIKYSKER
jgi:hypothetical protein